MFTVHNSSCGKVMFSQVCVKNSVHMGWYMAGGGGSCLAGEMATAVDGTHPTGMHSCLKKLCTHPITLIHLQIVNEKTKSKHKTEKELVAKVSFQI